MTSTPTQQWASTVSLNAEIARCWMTRRFQILHLSRINTELYRKSFAFRGSQDWNSLPEGIRNIHSTSVFRKCVGQWLQEQLFQCGCLQTFWHLHAQFSFTNLWHSLHVLLSLCFCHVTVCPAGPPGRPTTQADGAFLWINLSIYLSIWSTPYATIMHSKVIRNTSMSSDSPS